MSTSFSIIVMCVVFIYLFFNIIIFCKFKHEFKYFTLEIKTLVCQDQTNMSRPAISHAASIHLVMSPDHITDDPYTNWNTEERYWILSPLNVTRQLSTVLSHSVSWFTQFPHFADIFIIFTALSFWWHMSNHMCEIGFQRVLMPFFVSEHKNRRCANKNHWRKRESLWFKIKHTLELFVRR